MYTITRHCENKCTKYTYLIIFLHIQMNYMSITLSHGGTQFRWSERKQILTIERAIFEHTDAYYRDPHTFTKEKLQLNWQGLFERSVQYAIFSSLQPWQFHETGGWISFLFRVICLVASANQRIASAFYSKCACFAENIGHIAKRIAGRRSAQKIRCHHLILLRG